MAIIRIRDLPIEVRIGALPEERVSRQTVRLDLELRTDISAAATTDRLDATVNYIDVVTAARRAAETASCHLVETLVDHVLAAILELPGVEWARVRIRKFHLPGLGEVGSVEVEDERERR